MPFSDFSELKLPSYWKSVVNTMAEGLFIVDTQGIIRFINKRAELITGYKEQEVLGKPCSIFESDSCLACKDSKGCFYCNLFKNEQVSNKRCAIKRKNGAMVHLLKNATVLKDDMGNILAGIETITDISEIVEKDNQINTLKKHLKKEYGFMGMLGTSQPMLKLFELLDSAAQSQAPVVLLGESGTGKELAANAIHLCSSRAKNPFLKVNCAALNESVLESELFGHEKGAFTGADRMRKGRFEAALKGSLLLDEIGDLPHSVQLKLLRVLQEKEIERVGSHIPIKIDARIITATNKDLTKLVEQDKFRRDLYYRINVIPIEIPPLRKRKEDIPILVQNFLEKTELKNGKKITGLSNEAMSLLLHHNWPGNVRELINVIEYAFVTCKKSTIEKRHLPTTLYNNSTNLFFNDSFEVLSEASSSKDMRKTILAALAKTNGNKTKAAQILGISRVTLWKRIKNLGIETNKRVKTD